MVPSTSTVPNKAADYWDSVFAKTGSEQEATKQTLARFGPPKGKDKQHTVDSILAMPPPGMSDVESGGSSAPIQPAPQVSGRMAANAAYPMPPGMNEPVNPQQGTMPVGQALGAAGGSLLNTLGLGIPNAIGLTDPAAQAQLQQSDPALGMLAKAGGMVLGGMGITSAGKAFASTLVRTTGMSHRVANLLSSMGIGGTTGAASGAAVADPGSRKAGAMIGGAVGLALPVLLEITTGIKPFLGMVSKQHRQAVTDAFVLDRLASYDESVATALDRVTMLDDLATPPTNLLEAMGPAGPRAVKMIPPLTPAGQGKAFTASKELLDAVAPIVDRTKAVRLAVKDMGLSASEANGHVKLLMEVAEQRRALAKELLELAERDPESTQQLLQQFGASRVFGATMGKIATVLTKGPFAQRMADAQNSHIMNQLLDTDPMGYLTAMGGRMKSMTDQQAMSASVRGLLGGYGGKKAAKAMAGGPGTVFTPDDTK